MLAGFSVFFFPAHFPVCHYDVTAEACTEKCHPTSAPDEVVTVRQAAKLLKMTPAAIHKAIKRRRCHASKSLACLIRASGFDPIQQARRLEMRQSYRSKPNH